VPGGANSLVGAVMYEPKNIGLEGYGITGWGLGPWPHWTLIYNLGYVFDQCPSGQAIAGTM
jgi:hypothetical protein